MIFCSRWKVIALFILGSIAVVGSFHTAVVQPQLGKFLLHAVRISVEGGSEADRNCVRTKLTSAGFGSSALILGIDDDSGSMERPDVIYRWVTAMGLFRISHHTPGDDTESGEAAIRRSLPRFIDTVSEERLLTDRGWGLFANPGDEDDPAPYDLESLPKYVPAFLSEKHCDEEKSSYLLVSAMGYDVTPLTHTELEKAVKDFEALERCRLLGVEEGKQEASRGKQRQGVREEALEQRLLLTRRVCLEGATEPPRSGRFWLTALESGGEKSAVREEEKPEGVYVCTLSGLPLFSSLDKFESHSGWPSFTQTIDCALLSYLENHQRSGALKKESRLVDTPHVLEVPDLRHGGVEVLCARTRTHLGHVFDDGPRVLRGRPASGRRYCVNAAALRFVPLSLGNDAPALLSSAGSSRVRSSCSSNAQLVSDSVAPPVAGMRTEEETYASFQKRSTACDPVIRALAEAHMECTEVAIFAAGCFWSLELLMARVPGVLSAESGYAGLGDEWRSRGKVSASSRGKVPQLDKEVNAQGRAAAASPTVTYEEVCGGATGLAEAVRVRYDPRVVRFAILAELFLGHIGPKITSAGIGDDPLYAPGSGRFRSAFFYEGTALDHDGTEDRSAAALRKAILSAAAQLGCKADDIAVEVVTGERKRTAERGDVLFFPAEDYHQRYLAKNQGADETKTRFGVLQHELPAKPPQEVA